MTGLLILLTALGFGAGDFFGGMAARKVSATTISLWSQLVAATFAGVLAVLFGGAPSVSGLLWGFGAGLMVGFGIVRYYHGLTRGAMGWVATVMGVFSAVVPFVIGVVLGERPSLPAIFGVVAVMGALLLVIQRAEPKGPADPTQSGGLDGMWDGVLAGICFGLSFVFLGRGVDDNPFWSVWMVLAGSLVPLLFLWWNQRPGSGSACGALTWALIVVTGLCQGLGFMAFAIAVIDGYVSIVSVAGALSPVATSLLAFGVLCERMTRVQVAGVMAAMVGITLLVVG